MQSFLNRVFYICFSFSKVFVQTPISSISQQRYDKKRCFFNKLLRRRRILFTIEWAAQQSLIGIGAIDGFGCVGLGGIFGIGCIGGVGSIFCIGCMVDDNDIQGNNLWAAQQVLSAE